MRRHLKMSETGTNRKSSIHLASVSSWHKGDLFRPDSYRESDLPPEPAFSGSSALCSCGFQRRCGDKTTKVLGRRPTPSTDRIGSFLGSGGAEAKLLNVDGV